MHRLSEYLAPLGKITIHIQTGAGWRQQDHIRICSHPSSRYNACCHILHLNTVNTNGCSHRGHRRRILPRATTPATDSARAGANASRSAPLASPPAIKIVRSSGPMPCSGQRSANVSGFRIVYIGHTIQGSDELKTMVKRGKLRCCGRRVLDV